MTFKQGMDVSYRKGIPVKPLSRDYIREKASNIRSLVYSLTKNDPIKFNIVYFLDILLPYLDSDFSLEICTCTEMGSNHGLTIPSEHKIRIREDVFKGACQGNGRDRYTLAHELGHYLLHHNVMFACTEETTHHLPLYRNSEWQADCFAGELLMDFTQLDFAMPISSIANLCGVTEKAAMYQRNAIGLG